MKEGTTSRIGTGFGLELIRWIYRKNAVDWSFEILKSLPDSLVYATNLKIFSILLQQFKHIVCLHSKELSGLIVKYLLFLKYLKSQIFIIFTGVYGNMQNLNGSVIYFTSLPSFRF
jgi:hypothetical protein